MLDLILAGLGIVLNLQAIPGLTGVMAFFTFLGTQEFFLLVMPALFWCWDAGIGARMAVVLLASNSLNGLLKLAFAAPRPYWVDARVQALQAETSYGFPSGHAMNAASTWGFLASAIGRPAASRMRWWAWAAAAALALAISVSRLYLGVHFPLDVLGGWLFGGLLLAAYLRWEKPAAAWLAGRSLRAQLLIALAVSLGYLALAGGVYAYLANVADPAEWAQRAAAQNAPLDPRNAEGAFTNAGMLFGLGAALALLRRGPRFDAGGPWAQRAVRFAVGLAGVLLLWRGLGAVLPDDPLWLGLVLRWARYALTVFWVLYLAPRVFVRLKLARGG